MEGLDEIPFDFKRRMMSVLVEDPSGNPIELFEPVIEEARLRSS